MKRTKKTKTRKAKATSTRKPACKKAKTRGKKTIRRKAKTTGTTSKARIKRTIESLKANVKALEKEVAK